MRIALIIYGSLEMISGGYLYDRKLVEFLRNNGDEVDVISLPWRSYSRHLLDNFSRGLEGSIAHGKYDVVLQDELNHPSLLRLNSRLKGRMPLISIVHHLRISEASSFYWPLTTLHRLIERSYLRSVDGMLFTSHATLETVRKQDCLSQWRHVAHPAASHLKSAVIKSKTLTGLPRLLFVGNVIPRKGLWTLIQGMVVHIETPYQLTIAGRSDIDPDYTDYLRQYVKMRGLEARVCFKGAVSQQELIELYRNHDVFAMPSKYEGFGIVYLEAMSFGLPVIASSAGGAADIVKEGVNGYLAEPGNEVHVAAALRKLRDPGIYAQISTAALETYQNHPNWKTTMSGAREFLHTTAIDWKLS